MGGNKVIINTSNVNSINIEVLECGMYLYYITLDDGTICKGKLFKK